MARLTEDQWQEIQAMWCVGKRTEREIGAIFGISHTAIQKRAKRDNWQKLDQQVVDDAIKSEAKVAREVAKVARTAKLPEEKVAKEFKTQGKMFANVLDAGDDMAYSGATLARKMAEVIDTVVIESVDDMKPIMAMAQLVNETMKTPIKIVELQTKQPPAEEDQPQEHRTIRILRAGTELSGN